MCHLPPSFFLFFSEELIRSMAKHANGLSRGSGSISLMRIGLESFLIWGLSRVRIRIGLGPRCIETAGGDERSFGVWRDIDIDGRWFISSTINNAFSAPTTIHPPVSHSWEIPLLVCEFHVHANTSRLQTLGASYPHRASIYSETASYSLLR